MITGKKFEITLLRKKVERLQRMRDATPPSDDVALENQIEAHDELFKEVYELIKKIADKETAEDLLAKSFSPLAGADESDKIEFWRSFQKTIDIAQEWLSAFLEHNSPEEGLIEKPMISTNRVAPERTQRIFIGHGRSPLWRELKDFLEDTLKLEWEEFNRDVVAGISTTERISQMLEAASFAFIIMTAEDKHADGTQHARENVVHEAGLFQGKLGFRKAIILIEEGCEKFSNIDGLTHISFPKSNILACGEEIRRVLKREGIH